MKKTVFSRQGFLNLPSVIITSKCILTTCSESSSSDVKQVRELSQDEEASLTNVLPAWLKPIMVHFRTAC